MIERIEEFKVGIVGGGRRCRALLQAIFSEPDPAMRPTVLAVADTDEQAVGLKYARNKGIFTTTDFRELFSIEDLELILELTPDDSLKSIIQELKPPGVLLVDHYAARALLDKLQIKTKMHESLQRFWQEESHPDCEDLLKDFYGFVTQINQEANAYARDTREHLAASEAALSQIINGSPIAAFVIDRDHKVTHWNLACERLTGLTAKEVLGTDQHWKAFREQKRPIMADLVLDGVDDEELWRLYASKWNHSDLIEGAFESEDFFPHLGPEGTWLSFTAAPIKDVDGVVIGAIETLQDRTRQKQAETERERNNKELAAKVEELKSNRRVMSQIINGSTTFVIDRDHRITHWNKALERLSGYSAGDMIGTRRQWEPFYDQERPAMADVVLDQIDTTRLQLFYGSTWRQSVLIEDGWEAESFFPKLGNGGKWCWFTAAPLKTPDGQLIGAIETLWDKTEERQAATEQEHHTQELAAFCSIYATLSGPLNLEGRIKAAIKEAADIFQIDAICIFLLKPDGKFHLQHSYGYSDLLCFHNRIAPENSPLLRAADERRTLVMEHLPEYKDQETCLIRDAGLASLLYIPIFNREKETFGVIRVGSKKPAHFGTNEVRALELIANRIGVAIENSILEEDIRRQVDFQARLIGSSNDGIVATDDQWRIVIFNPMAETIFGYTKEEVIGRMDARQLFPLRVVEAFEEIAGTISGQGNLPWQEIVLHSRQGEPIPVFRFLAARKTQNDGQRGLFP